MIMRTVVLYRKDDPATPESKKSAYNTILHLIHEFRDVQDVQEMCNVLSSLSVVVMTTADCERGFSILKLVKTDRRNRLLAKNLNNAMLCAIEGEQRGKFDFQLAEHLWKSDKKRRIV